MTTTEPIWGTSSGRSPVDDAPFLTVHVEHKSIGETTIPSVSHIEDGPMYWVDPRMVTDAWFVDVPPCPSWIGRWDAYRTALRILLAHLPKSTADIPGTFFDLAWRKFGEVHHVTRTTGLSSELVD